MNWRRGLFRLWVAASAAWGCYVAALVALSITPGAAAAGTGRAEWLAENWFGFAAIAVAMPVVLAPGLLLAMWVGAGFRGPAAAPTRGAPTRRFTDDGTPDDPMPAQHPSTGATRRPPIATPAPSGPVVEM